MICVIDVIGGPAKGRRVWIRDVEQLQIGRHSLADLSIPADPHLSRRHLLIEGVNGKFRARDLGSANGTFVNRAGISAVELFDGDQLQVGSTLLALSFLPDGTNPHQKDGVVFKTLTPQDYQQPVVDDPTRRFDLPKSLQDHIEQQVDVEQQEVTSNGTHVN